jgi:hypothetical protein
MNSRFRRSILILVCGALAVANAIPQEQPTQRDSLEKYRMCSLQERMFDGYCMVSVIDLIANPELFDGQKVLIVGYVHVAYESRAVYLHKDDFLYDITRNALWLAVADSVDLKKCQNSYATVRGTFKAGLGGHVDAFMGTLDKVVGCNRISPRHG